MDVGLNRMKGEWDREDLSSGLSNVATAAGPAFGVGVPGPHKPHGTACRSVRVEQGYKNHDRRPVGVVKRRYFSTPPALVGSSIRHPANLR